MSTTPSPSFSPPGRFPLLGHVPSLVRHPLKFVQAVHSCGRVVKIYIGVKPAYFVNDPELIRHVLVSRAQEFDKGPLFANARVMVGNGVATSEGELHRRQRRLMQPAFHRSRIALYARIMGELATARMETWRAGQIVAMNDEMADLALAIAARTLFSASAGAEVNREVRRWLPIMMKGVFLRAILPFSFLGRLPTPGNREFNESLIRLKQLISGIVATRRREGDAHDDLLSMLLAARDQESGEAMTDQQVQDEILTLMIGGIESTAAALSWAFHELGRHPEIEERIRAEVDAVPIGQALSAEEVPKLDYTSRFVKEILRLYGPWLLTRRALSTLELGGVTIPAGSTVLYSPYAVHHDPRLYPDPTRLEPDRWLADRVQKTAFIPFGAGAHQCIGESFTLLEMITIVATITGRWRLRPVASRRAHEVVTGAIHPSELPMEVRPRHD
jgi:cytochrome P450